MRFDQSGDKWSIAIMHTHVEFRSDAFVAAGVSPSLATSAPNSMSVGSVGATHFSKIGGAASPSKTMLFRFGLAAGTMTNIPMDSSASLNRASLP